jgi:CelD/BcsL family acetyltransferase involved in cellulose biosynthesis
MSARVSTMAEKRRFSGRGRLHWLEHIELFNDFAAAAADWRTLERAGAVATPCQRFDWLEPWHRHVGTAQHIQPLIVVGYDIAGKPAFLWPLGTQRQGPVTVARFLGGKHANFNFALWRRDIAAMLQPTDVEALIETLSHQTAGVDLLMLLNQPEQWDGLSNPLLLLPHQDSPSKGYHLGLGGSADHVLARLSRSLRKRIRSKHRKLAERGAVVHRRATTAEEVERYLSVFLEQKSARFAEHGVQNAFSEPGVEAFLREASKSGIEQGTPVIEIHVLEGNGEVLALFSGTSDGRHFSCMFNSYTLGENARFSPGYLLLNELISDCANRGLKVLDLGVGEARYKAEFCDKVEPLFDSFLPLTPLGRLAALTYRSTFDVKRRIKQSPSIWATVTSLRRRLVRSIGGDDTM